MPTYLYIHRTDIGLAPCTERNVWTLALCKPSIRVKAPTGSVIIGVFPKQEGHELSFWAKVSRVYTTESYFRSFSPLRSDNIYELQGGRFLRHEKVIHAHHGNHLAYDLAGH